MRHDSKYFSDKVAVACFVAFASILFGYCTLKAQEPDFTYTVIDGKLFSVVTTDTASAVHGQDTAHHGVLRAKRKIPWNNHRYFENRDKTRFLDWSDYMETWDKKEMATLAAFAVSGAAWGMREAYHADPYVFEKRWGVSETSFWGSDAWKRNYVGNDPDGEHKLERFGNFGRDIWHTAGAISKIGFFSCSFVIGSRNQPKKYRIANAAIGFGTQALFSVITYNSLRKTW